MTKADRREYLIVEYCPHVLHHEKPSAVRIDGHYWCRHFRTNDGLGSVREICDLWAENPIHEETRIVVCEVVYESKKPKSWKKDAEPELPNAQDDLENEYARNEAEAEAEL